MCILKTIFGLSHRSLQNLQKTLLDEKFNIKIENPPSQQDCFICPCPQKCCGVPWSEVQINLIKLYSKLNQTSKIMNDLSQKLTEAQEKLSIKPEKYTFIKVEEEYSEKEENHQNKNQSQNQEIALYTNLFSQFGINWSEPKDYKLTLVDSFKQRICKDRNFQIKVKLTTINNTKQKVINGNMLNLCVGLFDANGNWITQNKAKQPILKGRTQVQMLNGQALLQKLSVREISGYYPEGYLNIVVYVKPSTMKYGNMSILLNTIEWNNILPVFLKKIKVMSRKQV